MNLKSKVAVVTGASKGLGLAFSEALINRGAVVYALARSVDQMNENQRRLGEDYHPVGCDVRSESDVQEAFESILREQRSIDILINNAGLGRFDPVDELSIEDWKVQMETNLNGTFLCTRAVVPAMKKQNERDGFGGHIINISSIAGTIGNPELSGYNASKYGVRGFSDALMKELRTHNIKISCVMPGSVDTSFFSRNTMEKNRFAMRAQDVADTVVHILEAPDNYLISEVIMRPLRTS